MSDWQERITRETAPAIRVEHELRYRLAAPLILDSAVWADLGCGNGVAAAVALGDERPARIVLVDRAAEVLAAAARELALGDAVQRTADLSDPADLDAIAGAVLDGGGQAVVTCFEVVEHLETFVPLLEWSGRLAREHGVTFLLSVPNDAFWSIDNPHHRSVWGEGAFEELRRLLPGEQTLLRQVALAGSALVGWDESREEHRLQVVAGGEATVATHFIAAFGPRHAQLTRSALSVQTDMAAQRRWERQRESDLALAQALTHERDEWRAYIHELERELGRPPSGMAQPQPAETADPPGVKVAFLVNDLQLSGGVGIVTQHAHRLGALEGWDVSLVLVREQEQHSWQGYEHLPGLHVRSRAEALEERYDVAIATWWETTFTLFDIAADRHAYFVQSLEDRFYGRDEAERFAAGLTLDLPVAFITEARWIADTLGAMRPDAQCYLVRNGIDKQVFAPPMAAPINIDGPLRVLVEGSPGSWFKHVHDAIGAAGAMREAHRLTVVCGDRAALGEVQADEILGPLSHREMAAVYGRTDVVLKLSSVEGMFGPPLEGFHRGATCVVTPVTGHEEYVEHAWNGLLADWGDMRGTARQLDLLARDRELLHFLRCNALETARSWPSLDQSSQFMAAALRAIRDSPPPAAGAGAARLLGDVRAGVETYHRHLRERSSFERRALRFERPIRSLLALRRFRALRLLTWPLRPLTRRVRRALSG